MTEPTGGSRHVSARFRSEARRMAGDAKYPESGHRAVFPRHHLERICRQSGGPAPYPLPGLDRLDGRFAEPSHAARDRGDLDARSYRGFGATAHARGRGWVALIGTPPDVATPLPSRETLRPGSPPCVNRYEGEPHRAPAGPVHHSGTARALKRKRPLTQRASGPSLGRKRPRRAAAA